MSSKGTAWAVAVVLSLLSVGFWPGPGAWAQDGGARAPGVVWTADAERPVEAEWGGLSCPTVERVRRVEWPRSQGSYAYEVTVEDGDSSALGEERCELTQSEAFRLPGTTLGVGERKFARGDERWIAFQVRVGEDWDAQTPLFNNFLQLKNDGSGGPPLKMAIDEGRIQLGGIDRAYQAAPNFLRLWSTPFTAEHRNRWLRFVLNVRFDYTRDGFVALYGDLDGRGTVELFSRTQIPTMKRIGVDAIPSHARIGIYRDAAIAGRGRMWFDGYVVATTREAAEGLAFSASGVPEDADRSEADTGAVGAAGRDERRARSPFVRLLGVRGARLRAALDGRMVVRAACAEPCRLSARLVLGRTPARRLRVGRRDIVIARGSARAAPRGAVRARLRATASRVVGRRAVRAGAVRATLVVEAVDRSGRRTVVRRPLALR